MVGWGGWVGRPREAAQVSGFRGAGNNSIGIK